MKKYDEKKKGPASARRHRPPQKGGNGKRGGAGPQGLTGVQVDALIRASMTPEILAAKAAAKAAKAAAMKRAQEDARELRAQEELEKRWWGD